MQSKKLSVLIKASVGVLLITLVSQGFALIPAKTIKTSQKTININKASAKSLAVLSGIGKKTAAAIVVYRKKNGDFKSINELTKIRGINKNTLTRIGKKNAEKIVVQKSHE